MGHEGFRQFVELRYGDLLRTAFLLTGTAYAAEDLVQTALLNAWRRLAARELITGMLPEESTPDPTADFAQRAEFLDALGRLPRRMRAVLVLRYWEELSEVDTAVMLNCSVGTLDIHTRS